MIRLLLKLLPLMLTAMVALPGHAGHELASRRGLLDWASLPLIMPALVIGKGGENRRGQLQIEGEHPRAVACGNAISVGKSPLPAVKISPLARVVRVGDRRRVCVRSALKAVQGEVTLV